MAKVGNLKRIVKEDFDQEDQPLIDKLAFSLNPFLEQVVSAFDKNLDFDNLNQAFVTVDTEVNNLGVPKLKLELKSQLKTRVRGMLCVSAQNLTDTTFPTSAPFITYTVNNGIITFNNITGLPANKKFRLSLILIG